MPVTGLQHHFCPCDAILARVLGVLGYWAWCLPVWSVSVSITSRCFVELTEQVELVFGIETSFDLSCSMF